MPTVLFYFDFASSIAYVMFHRLPHVLAGLAWQVHYRPVSQAAVGFDENGLEAKKQTAAANQSAESLHDVQALAAHDGLPFRWPVNVALQSAAWLHMAQASSVHGQPSRQVCETLLNAIWQTGQDPDDPAVQQQAWQAATALLPSVRDVHQPAVLQALEQEIANNMQAARQQSALQQGAWAALPSCVLLPADGTDASPQVFAGLEGLPLLREAVRARQDFAADESDANA
ncbi:MAG: DsbA family protein [Brachymonas sp.]|nr:DsbA family protein [Brachymonas sp.]